MHIYTYCQRKVCLANVIMCENTCEQWYKLAICHTILGHIQCVYMFQALTFNFVWQCDDKAAQRQCADQLYLCCSITQVRSKSSCGLFNQPHLTWLLQIIDDVFYYMKTIQIQICLFNFHFFYLPQLNLELCKNICI